MSVLARFGVPSAVFKSSEIKGSILNFWCMSAYIVYAVPLYWLVSCYLSAKPSQLEQKKLQKTKCPPKPKPNQNKKNPSKQQETLQMLLFSLPHLFSPSYAHWVQLHEVLTAERPN